jgi:predicted metal-dependent HD superfamily phosphohydrolase
MFQVQCDTELLNFVRQYYNQPHRYFHDWSHIEEGFSLANELRLVTPDFELNIDQQLAWLFHDIVYIPKVSGNERNSVSLMNHILNLPQFSYVTRFAELIIMSKATHIATQPISAPVLDLDRSCFAFMPNLRKANTDIIEEFQLDNVEGRIHFLEDLNSRQIYHTQWCLSNWEDVAHRNIQNCILELEYL